MEDDIEIHICGCSLVVERMPYMHVARVRFSTSVQELK